MGTESDAVAAARAALAAGRADLAMQALVGHAERGSRDPAVWRLLGLAYGREQRMPEAATTLRRAVELAPDDPDIVFDHAQASLDAGLPAATPFEDAHRLAPDNLDAIGGWAAALAAQGQWRDAEALLADTLSHHAEWLAGHAALTALRFTNGRSEDFDRSYAAACTALPRQLALRLAWFSTAMQAHDWTKARAIIADGERQWGPTPALAAARAVIAGESGEEALATALFTQTAALTDPALRMAHLRHCLRIAQFEHAQELALGLLRSSMAAHAWPYLSLIWRLRKDPRAAWLDGAPPFVRVFDLDFASGELEQLAQRLRRLHLARGPFIEQSVRGGTQTETQRQLFYRAEPEIQKLRARVSAAVQAYVDELPPPVPGHPLLAGPRGRVRYAGSWSVRLSGRGFHVSHTHPRGWISSALYVALPDSPGSPPAGWISFGAPPRDLNLELPPYASVEPKPGRLVLFPSTLWHATLPFEDGERLSVAFDVMRTN